MFSDLPKRHGWLLGLDQSSGYDYSRLQNPTRKQVEKTVVDLGNGSGAVVFSSGMVAITAIFELAHLLATILSWIIIFMAERAACSTISVKKT